MTLRALVPLVAVALVGCDADRVTTETDIASG